MAMQQGDMNLEFITPVRGVLLRHPQADDPAFTNAEDVPDTYVGESETYIAYREDTLIEGYAFGKGLREITRKARGVEVRHPQSRVVVRLLSNEEFEQLREQIDAAVTAYDQDQCRRSRRSAD